MAWTKDVYFLTKTDTVWTGENPVIPAGAIIFVDTEDGRIRLKLGNGNAYNDTEFLNQSDLDGKVDLGTDPEQVIFDDGSRGIIDTLTIQEIIDAGYHLVTDAEWTELQKYSFAPPSFVATPQFDTTTIRDIGDAISGAYVFDLVKNNNTNFLATTGGNSTINQGSWSGDGDFDIANSTQLTLTATSFSLSSAGFVTFTLFGRDIQNQTVSQQTFNIEFQYPVWGGTRVDKTLSEVADLSNVTKRQGATADGMEFYLDPGGTLHYFHILVPTEIAANLDIRDMAAPAPGSGNMTLQGTVLLTVGTISKTYNHYVSDYQSAGEVDFLLKDIV